MRKFGRDRAHRTSMLKNLCSSLIKSKYMVTTIYKAKDVKRMIEKLISKAIGGDTLHNRRILLSKLHNNNEIVNELFKISSKYVNRQGGYTSLLRCGIRASDGSQMARIEILEDVQVN